MKVGIDAGGTLIKIVQEQGNERFYRTELTTNIDKVIDWLNNEDIESLNLTGGNAGVIAEHIKFQHKAMLNLMHRPEGCVYC